MKKKYHVPMAKKIDYALEEHVSAESYPVNNYADPWHTNKVCTYGDGSCSLVYHTPKMARGLYDCFVQGTVPGVG